MRSLGRLASLLLLASLLSACAINPPTPATDPSGALSSPEPSGPSQSNPPVEVSPIPVIRTAPAGGELACAGVGMAAVLRGDPADPQVAWLEQFPSGPPRLEIIWPTGFTARFNPDLEILDETGHVAIRGGDFVDGACVTRQPTVFQLYPDFLALRLECGPMPIPECRGAQLFQLATANGWPEREIAELRFLSDDGRYVVVFEDGSQASGVYVPN